MLQHVATLPFRQIDIENDKGGTRHTSIGVGRVEKPHSLVSILCHVERERKLHRRNRFLYQEYVGFVIFDKEHMVGSAGGVLSDGERKAEG